MTEELEQRKSLVLIVGVLSLVIFKDFFMNPLAQRAANVQQANSPNSVDDDNNNVLPDLNGPGSTLSTGKIGGPVVKFHYCSSCGYHGAFQKLSEFLLQQHPELIVEGETHSPNLARRLGAQFTVVLKFAILGCIIMATNPFTLLGITNGSTLKIWNYIQTNKIFASMMIFFCCNFLESQLSSTGAFEIFFNDVPIWSKLQTGRFPNPGELLQIVENNMKLLNSMDGLDMTDDSF